jgi:hypothetical protein
MGQQRRRKRAKTRRMPIEAEQTYIEWMRRIPKPSRDDRGTGTPPVPPQLGEPREPGTADEQQ